MVIFSFCTLKDLFRLSAVCHDFRTLASSDVLWNRFVSTNRMIHPSPASVKKRALKSLFTSPAQFHVYVYPAESICITDRDEFMSAETFAVSRVSFSGVCVLVHHLQLMVKPVAHQQGTPEGTSNEPVAVIDEQTGVILCLCSEPHQEGIKSTSSYIVFL
ncbi:hypothetical protein Pelo_18341 [Pelomyxa schiedti]|nr:hypothetical protein Pelo_18341 [Pelomyxa schiedti]